MEPASAALDYDAATAVLRRRLLSSHANASAMGSRARRGDGLVSGRTWGELATIEGLLVSRLESALSSELRVEPWPGLARARALYTGLYRGFRGERELAELVFRDARDEPVAEWRAQTPQLEATLWPFWVDRNHYVANSLALALSEPAPFPALIWVAREGTFRRAAGSAR